MSNQVLGPITTERLVLRAPTVEDAEELNAAIHETWDLLHLWMPWAVTKPSMDESRAKCAEMADRAAMRGNYPLAGFDRATGRLALFAGVHPRDLEVPSYAIGYWCRARFHGQGLVTEAVRALTDVCFNTLSARRVEITCSEQNTASRRVAERSGFQLEGRHVNDCRDKTGTLRTTLVYAQTREDLEALAG
jgi:RimJ/RimL family protein N-acetyltransferase